jgi:Glycosyltransferase family 87
MRRRTDSLRDQPAPKDEAGTAAAGIGADASELLGQAGVGIPSTYSVRVANRTKRFVIGTALRDRITASAVILCGLVAVILVLEAFSGALHNSHDNDWGPARALLHGLDPYKLYLACTDCTKPPFVPPVDPMYPASGLILLWPLALLSWPMAKVAWALVNLALGAGLLFTLHRLFLARDSWRSLVIAIIALFASGPFLTNLEIGQHAIFALGWFAAALWAEKRGNSVLAMAFLAAAWFKYSLTLPLSLLFVARSRWMLLLGAALIHAALTIFAAIWTGSSPLDLLVGPLRVVHLVHRAGHLDVFGLAMRLGLTSKVVPVVVATALAVAVITAVLRTKSQNDLLLLSLLSLFAYAVVYHLAYDLVILAIPLIYVVSQVRSWDELSTCNRIWTMQLTVLLGWTWFVDHLVQMLKIRHIGWVVHAYPSYYAALAVWFYATTFVGIIVLAARAPSRRKRKTDPIA